MRLKRKSAPRAAATGPRPLRLPSHLPAEGTRLAVPAGTQLVRENESSRKMFVIRAGKARVYKMYMGHRVTLAILGEGEVFGELAFFDAEPRSASVEALTDLSVSVLDGDQAKAQIANLPPWIFPIFRTVFHRFREADRKIAVLQSMNEFQKRNFKADTVAKHLYLEILRFIRALELVHEKVCKESKGAARSDAVYGQLDDLLGSRMIGLRIFWKLLKEYDFIDNRREEADGVLELNQAPLEKWKEYLAIEIKEERFLLLSHSSIALLGRVIGFANQATSGPATSGPGGSTELEVLFADIGLENLPLYQEALKELKARGLIKHDLRSLSISRERLGPLYTYQSILKTFDHTIVSLE